MKTAFGYKLFEQDKNGILYPLFIGKDEPVPVGEWLTAKYLPTKGFAPRGGWHLGADDPDAAWLKGYDGTDKGCYKSRWKTGRRVWGLVEYNATIDYNDKVSLLKKKCFADRVPENGYYFFRECGKGTWIITSHICVVHIIEEDERQSILKAHGYDEVAVYADYKHRFENRRNKGKLDKDAIMADLIANGYILDRKDRYTMKDVKTLMTTWDKKSAMRIVELSAAYHGVEFVV